MPTKIECKTSKKLCECGCGNPVPLASKTNKKRGWIKGRPIRFIWGHSGHYRKNSIFNFVIDKKTGCWIWNGYKDKNGYGHISNNGKNTLAHRYIYELYRGQIPDNLTLDHLCENTSCVNPFHLEALIHAENCRRGKQSKLSHKIVRKIKYMNKIGLSTATIARQHGVAWHTVNSVLKETAWA